jgi:hypothetical protein
MRDARKTLVGGSHAHTNQSSYAQLYDGVEVAILERISKVSAKHRSLLYETLSELERNTRLNFTRIFPSPGCSYYDQFFETIRPNNKLIYKYLCQRTELWAIIEQSCFSDLDHSLDNVLGDIPKNQRNAAGTSLNIIEQPLAEGDGKKTDQLDKIEDTNED